MGKKNKNSNIFKLKRLAVFSILLGTSNIVWADSVYPNTPLVLAAGQTSVKTNLLLFIDTSASMNDNGKAGAAKEAAKKVIQEAPGYRWGLATFNDPLPASQNRTKGVTLPYMYGAKVRVGISDSSQSHIDKLKTEIDRLSFTGSVTPTTSAYYELTRYFRGMTGAYPEYGGSNDPNIKYTSPIEYRCQKNAIIFISDGEPFVKVSQFAYTGSGWGRNGLPDQDLTWRYNYDQSDKSIMSKLKQFLSYDDQRILNSKVNSCKTDREIKLTCPFDPNARGCNRMILNSLIGRPIYQPHFQCTPQYPPYIDFGPLVPAYKEGGPFGNASTREGTRDADGSKAGNSGGKQFVYSCSLNNTCSMYTELGMAKFAKIAHTKDMMVGGVDKEGVSFDDPEFPKQTIETYTIGFGADIGMLRQAAREGGGQYFVAGDAGSLSTTLKKILSSIPVLSKAAFSSGSAPVIISASNKISSSQTISLDTKNWSSQLRFYNVVNGRVGSNYVYPTYKPSESVTVISTESGPTLLTSGNSVLSNDTFSIRSGNREQWKKLVTWLTRVGDDASTGYRKRSPNESRYLGDVINGNLIGLGLDDGSGALNQKYLAVGSNDGMLHVYRKFGNRDNDYQDIFQYIPGLAKNSDDKTINSRLQDTAIPSYGAENAESHRNLVNGPASWRETYDSRNRSRIYLTGTLGQGGRAAYALNIAGKNSDNSAVGLDEQKSNWVRSVPLWDTSSQKIGNAYNGIEGVIGHTFGEPLNARVAMEGSIKASAKQYKSDIRYATILGSGFDPERTSLGEYLAPSIFVLDSLGINAGAGADGSYLNERVNGQAPGTLLTRISVAGLADNIDTMKPRGMTAATGLDIDGDGLLDVAYAGDQNGNVYRFDFRADKEKWNAEIIFKGNDRQPITAQPNVYRNPATKRVTVLFGTGSELYSDDVSKTGMQRFYGIYDPLTDNPEIGGDLSQSRPEYPIQPDTSSLVKRDYNQQGASGNRAIRTFSSRAPFDFQVNNGWYIDLTNNGRLEGERVVTMPEVGGSKAKGGSVIFTTKIINPSNSSSNASCSSGRAQSNSFLMIVNAETGGTGPALRFDKGNPDLIGEGYDGGVSGGKLYTNNPFEQTIPGGFKSGKSFRFGSNPPIPSGCVKNSITLGLASSYVGGILRDLYCEDAAAVRRIAWREIF